MEKRAQSVLNVRMRRGGLLVVNMKEEKFIILLFLRVFVTAGTRLPSRWVATIEVDTHSDARTDGSDS